MFCPCFIGEAIIRKRINVAASMVCRTDLKIGKEVVLVLVLLVSLWNLVKFFQLY